MQYGMDTLEVAVIGGDRRESAAAAYLAEKGARVRIYGPPPPEDAVVYSARNLVDAVKQSQVVVAPVRGLDADNHLYGPPGMPGLWLTEKVMEHIPRGALFFIGQANAWLRERCEAYGFTLVELLKRDDFSIYNSIPTAEGAIQKAMEESDITIFDSQCFVLGYGRTGMTIAQALAGLNARVTVVAREPAGLARAAACGLQTVEFSRLGDYVEEADFIFNTVPDLVLTAGVIERTKRTVIIVDIASAPGGTDFPAAERQGRKAFLVPGLPGKVAPRSAGRILGQVVWKVASEVLAVPGLTS